jgi:hypothetical protein
MEFKTTLEIVTKDIQDIEKLVSNFKNYSRIPNIELDLALSRLMNVYDLLLMFRYENTGSGEAAVVSAPEPKPVENPVKKVDTPQPSVDEPVKVQEVVNTFPPPVEKQVVKEVLKPAEEKHHGKKKVEEETKFINEKLGEQTLRKNISSKIQNQAISSISGSIGINDKFLFIRELFGGNAENFRQTMEDLDLSHNFNEAYSILIERFQWDMDSEPVQLLLNLIRRKFISGGDE